MNKQIYLPCCITKNSHISPHGFLAYQNEHDAIQHIIYALFEFKHSLQNEWLYLTTLSKFGHNQYVVSEIIPSTIKDCCHVTEKIQVWMTTNPHLFKIEREWVSAKDNCEMVLESCRYYVVNSETVNQTLSQYGHSTKYDALHRKLLEPFLESLELEEDDLDLLSSEKPIAGRTLIAMPLVSESRPLKFSWSNK